MGKSIGAVLAGFLLIGVLSFGTETIIHQMSAWAFRPDGSTSNVTILLLTTVYSAVFGMVGCYVAARLAPSSPMMHAMVLGVIGVIVTGAFAAMRWSAAPVWFHVLNVAVVLPLAWLAGYLRENEVGAPS